VISNCLENSFAFSTEVSATVPRKSETRMIIENSMEKTRPITKTIEEKIPERMAKIPLIKPSAADETTNKKKTMITASNTPDCRSGLRKSELFISPPARS